MADVRAIRKTEDGELEHLVRTYLIGIVEFGYVKINYEHGRPTLVERFEQVRLTGGTGAKPA
jgi:hypothetical protein